ncbi:MAG: hypothetical protein ACFFFG_02305 [Candidatus Thorarchaeota archaeon]
MRKPYTLLLGLIFLPLFVLGQTVTAHEGYHDTVLDTGDVTGPIQSALVGLGLLIFASIISKIKSSLPCDLCIELNFGKGFNIR